jgi:hypothetical protein
MTKRWNDHRNHNSESVSAKKNIFYHPPRVYPSSIPTGPTTSLWPWHYTRWAHRSFPSTASQIPEKMKSSSTVPPLHHLLAWGSACRRRVAEWLPNRSRASSSIEVESTSCCHVKPSSCGIEPCWPPWSTLAVSTRLWCRAARVLRTSRPELV